MDLAALHKVATAMTQPGKGILAADESSGTIKKRFDAIGVQSTARLSRIPLSDRADDEGSDFRRHPVR